MTSFQSNAPIANEGYVVSNATASSDPFITVFAQRDPTQNDYNYPVKKRWINLAAVREWILAGFSNDNPQGLSLANWIQITTGGFQIETLSDDLNTPVAASSDSAVPPDNIQLTGEVPEQSLGFFSTTVSYPSANQININPMSPNRWIVDGLGLQGTNRQNGTHTTIQSAIDDATAGDTIRILTGTYTENPDLKPGVNLEAAICDAYNSNVTILGTCTLTQAGAVSISGINLQTNGSYFLSVTGSVNSVVNLNNCKLTCANFTGILFNSTGTGAIISITNCQGNLAIPAIALYSMTSAGVLQIVGLTLSNSGASSTISNNSSGVAAFYNSALNSPIGSTSTGALTFYYSTTTTSVTNSIGLTFNGSGTSLCKYSQIYSGSAASISIGSAATLICEETIVNSSATNAITGSGIIEGNSITFENSAGINIIQANIIPNVYGITGTWTPTLDGSTPGSTVYAGQYGYYQILGNLVFASFFLNVTSATGMGYMKIGGLPFTVRNQAGGTVGGNLIIGSGSPLTWPSGATMLSLYSIPGQKYMQIYGSGSGQTTFPLQMANTTMTLNGSITYQV
jgi:hypothetical protein